MMYHNEQSQMSEHKFIFTRILVGEIMLLISVFWLGGLGFRIFDHLENTETLYLTGEIATDWILSLLRFVVFFGIGSWVGYGRFSPFHGRTFKHDLMSDLKNRSLIKLWSIIVISVGLILLVIGTVYSLATLLFFEEGEYLAALSGFLFIPFPMLIFGYKWLEGGRYMKRVKQIGDKERPMKSRLISKDEIDTYQSQSEKFKVIKPSLLTYLIFILLTIIMNSVFIRIFSFGLMFTYAVISVIITLVSWRYLTPKVVNLLILDPIRSWNQSVAQDGETDISKSILQKLISFFFDIKFSEENVFYIEENPTSLNLNNIWTFLKSRFVPLLLTTIPLSFIMLYIIYPPNVLASEFSGDEISLTYTLAKIMVFSPIITFWIIPLIWLVKDMRLKQIDGSQSISLISEKIERSKIERFLGISGLLAGIGYMLELYRTLPQFSLSGGNWENTSDLLLDVVVYMWFLVSLYVGIAFFVTIVYYIFIHQNIVNHLREEIGKFTPYCNTFATRLSEDEVSLFYRITE